MRNKRRAGAHPLNHKSRWTARKIAQRVDLVQALVYRSRQPLPPFRYLTLESPLAPPPVDPDVDDSHWASIKPNTYWAGWLTDFVLRVHFQRPADWSPHIPTALYLPLGKSGDFEHPEALAYVDGVAYAACDRHHEEILLPARWLDGHSHLLALHGWTGLGGWMSGSPQTRLFMRECALVQIDQPTRDFVTTARCALGVAKALDENEPAKGQLLTALDEAFKILDTREPFGEAFYASVPLAHAALREGVAKAGPALDVTITAAGHAHIDVAWLWTLGQSRRKAGRTFHSVLRLMEQFPAYHFTQSQPQLYDFVCQDYPELFKGIKQRVAEGRWEPIGGMWVEADCNLSGSESLARQFLLGRTFFREHFGPEADARVLWLPDVFGYAWNLPQLIRQAGLEYFFTIKIGWSQYNRLPYDSFWWQGLDGTKVLTHFSPTPELGESAFASTYNAEVTPSQVIGTWTNYRQKDLVGADRPLPLLMAFGYGDGGGGPSREMLENLRELENFPATPRLRQGSVYQFFHDLEAQAGKRLPTWNGELYLELHRGTYTTQSRSKRANRKSEFLLHDAEFLATYASSLDSNDPYPAAELRRAWELVCLNQFHDIIPGSSVGPVYVESQQQYAEIRRIGEAVRDAALRTIADKAGGDLLIVNPASFRRLDLAFWPGRLPDGYQLQDWFGNPIFTQPTEEGTWLSVSIGDYDVEPLFLLPARASQENIEASSHLQATPTLLENYNLRVELNADGDITRIYDKVCEREVLPAGAMANQFQAFEDRPLDWDAWDVDIFYDDKMWLAEPAESVRVVEAGPLRATLEIKRRVLNSDYTQRISLAEHGSRLDFDTTIDWRERHVLLKVAFPVNILSPVATYEIQWGNVQRPTHHNTSWDWARFETCAHKWVDLSEGGYGVSLLNDCKYGHDIRDNVIRLSLLRGPTLPDPEADQGEHRFAYSLLAHDDGFFLDETVCEAYSLNDPLIVWPMSRALQPGTGERRRRLPPLIWMDPPGDRFQARVVIETIKRAEDGKGFIVRLYEYHRRRGPVTLHTGFPLSAAWRTNLLEENQETLTVEDESPTLEGQMIASSSLTLFVKPYEIVTLRLAPKVE